MLSTNHEAANYCHFRRVRIGTKSAYYLRHVRLFVRPSVRLPSCVSAILIGQIYVKFEVGNLYENMSRKSKFG
jgi:hypothetical protein